MTTYVDYAQLILIRMFSLLKYDSILCAYMKNGLMDKHRRHHTYYSVSMYTRYTHRIAVSLTRTIYILLIILCVRPSMVYFLFKFFVYTYCVRIEMHMCMGNWV